MMSLPQSVAWKRFAKFVLAYDWQRDDAQMWTRYLIDSTGVARDFGIPLAHKVMHGMSDVLEFEFGKSGRAISFKVTNRGLLEDQVANVEGRL